MVIFILGRRSCLIGVYFGLIFLPVPSVRVVRTELPTPGLLGFRDEKVNPNLLILQGQHGRGFVAPRFILTEGNKIEQFLQSEMLSVLLEVSFLVGLYLRPAGLGHKMLDGFG